MTIREYSLKCSTLVLTIKLSSIPNNSLGVHLNLECNLVIMSASILTI